MDWDKIERLREIAEKAEKFHKHIDALEKFQQNQQRLDEIEKQINKRLKFDKHLDNLNRGILCSEVKSTDSTLNKFSYGRDINLLEMECVHLVNEQMRLRTNPDLHRFTARERFEYQTARYDRITDRLQSSLWMPKDLLSSINFEADTNNRNIKTLGPAERNIKNFELADKNLRRWGIDDNFKKIGVADDRLKTLVDVGEKSQMLGRTGLGAFGGTIGEPIFNLKENLVKSRGFINDYQKAFFNHSDALGNRVATKMYGVWQYVVYDAFGKLVAEYGIAAESSGGVKYVQQDWQGSVRTVTNNNGFVVARTDHQAFGEDVGLGIGLRSIEQGYNTDKVTRQGYGLTENDKATGQQHTWFRKLETMAGRWTRPDPYKGSMSISNPQSFNRYSYVNNEPTNFI